MAVQSPVLVPAYSNPFDHAVGKASKRFGGFTPLTLGPSVWWDFADQSSMYQDVAGTTPVTAGSQPVGLVLDKSGNGRHLSQATAAKRPTFNTSGGLSWLEFAGSHSLSSGSVDLSATNVLSYLIGITPGSTAASGSIEFSNSTLSNNGSFYALGPNDPSAGHVSIGARAAGAIDAIDSAATTFGSGTTSVISNLIDLSKAPATQKLTGRINGQSGLFTQLANGSDTASNFGNYPFYVGARAGTSSFFTGKMYGFFVVPRLMTASEIASAEKWLAARAGLSL